MSVVAIYDPDPRDLANRERIVHGQLEARSPGCEWRLEATASRNELLRIIEHVGTTGGGSVALIDLREDDLDISYHGYRVVDTIRRHPDLSIACRPVVWTSYATQAVLEQCNAIGAYGVLSDSWILNTPGDPLVEIVAWAFDQRPVHRRFGNPFRAYHRAGADPTAEERVRDARFVEWFGLPANGEYLALLWGLAHEVDQTYLKRYLVEQRVVTSVKSAEDRLEKLRAAMHARFAGRNDAITARKFLAQIMPAAPNLRFAELDLPRVSEAQRLWREEPDVRTAAYLSPSDAEIFDSFAAGYREPGGPGRVAASTIATSVQAYIEDVAASRDIPAGAVRDAVYRGVRALDDAKRSARTDSARRIGER